MKLVTPSLPVTVMRWSPAATLAVLPIVRVETAGSGPVTGFGDRLVVDGDGLPATLSVTGATNGGVTVIE